MVKQEIDGRNARMILAFVGMADVFAFDVPGIDQYERLWSIVCNSLYKTNILLSWAAEFSF